MNNGDGTYAAPHTYGIAQTGYEIEVEDFNSDGNDDFAVRGDSQYMVQPRQGRRHLLPGGELRHPGGPVRDGRRTATSTATARSTSPTRARRRRDRRDERQRRAVPNLAGAVGFNVTAAGHDHLRLGPADDRDRRRRRRQRRPPASAARCSSPTATTRPLDLDALAYTFTAADAGHAHVHRVACGWSPPATRR